ncbi:MAG: hypothetical protein HZB38_03630 [Planctomycetes bacterium]|nr:hypothetical protein [Planctomycetota bacterium]
MSDNASIPSPAIGSSSWRLTGAVLPEALTAFQTLILAIAVIALFCVHSSAVQRAATSATSQQARGIAERIAAEQELNPEEPEALLARYEPFFRLAGVTSVRLLTADGQQVAAWPENGPRPGHYTGAGARVTRADSRVRRIEIALPDPDFTDSTTEAIYRGAPVVVLALLGQWWIYRRLRRHAQPLSAIQDNVERYASGMQQRFAALTLSDTLGHVAQAWNKLVSDVAELQAQLPREAESPSAALRRMESKYVAEVLDPLPIGVVRIAPDGMVQQANATAARLLRAEGQPCGRKLSDWSGDPNAEEWIAACRVAGARAIVREVGGPEDRLALRIRLASIGGNGGDRLLIVEEAGRSCAEEPVEQHLRRRPPDRDAP